MKRSWIITILFCLLLLGVGVTVILLPQTVPYSQCSEVYQRYASVDGIDATFIRDYQVNDTLAIDATLLHATDSASWERLLNDFNLPETTKEIAKESPNTIFVRRVSRKNPHVRADSPDEPFYILATIYSERSIHIYDVKDFDQNVDLHIQLVLNMTKHN